MKKSLQLLFVLIFTFSLTANTYAQSPRYLNEIFTSVNITSNVQYAENYSVFPPPGINLIPLMMDVYEPAGDTLSARPVIILMHTGSYLPMYFNGTPTGDKNDSATVEMAMQFAKRGYVVANIEYRIGWNPAATNIDIRRGTLLQAVYRSIQDAKACVRYFKKDFNTVNIFKIDTGNVFLGGQGTGGYIALNYISLDDPAELNIPKLISGTTDPGTGLVAGQSYINQALYGDLDGFGGNPALNNANNSPGYDNKVHFAFNLGGALGDSTWIEPGDVPTVAFHVVGDPFAPFGPGMVYVPGNPPQAVIDVIGSGNVLALANQYGNNNCITPDPNNDVYTQAANSVNNGYEGLFPFNMVNPPDQSGPWDWWDSLTVVQGAALFGINGTDVHMYGLNYNPNMSKAKALAYIDTVMGYLNPRMAYCRLGAVGLEENALLESQISISPNPATENINISINTLDKLNAIEVFDIAGRKILPVTITEKLQYSLDVSQLESGIYLIHIQTIKGIATKKILIQ